MCTPSQTPAGAVDPTVSKSDSSSPPLRKSKKFDPRYLRNREPWYRRGGNSVNNLGIFANTVFPMIYMVNQVPRDDEAFTVLGLSFQAVYYAVLFMSMFTSYAMGMRTFYCVVVVPLYFCTLSLWVYGLPELSERAPDETTPLQQRLWLFTVALLLGTVVKIGIPMSVCLHRYAAHAAFSCGPVTQVVMLLIGCLANQGGPIWWAATHRVHHKHCDMPGDPHSPLMDGVEGAFAFFNYKTWVRTEYVPQHLEGKEYLWVLDNWAFLVHTAEMAISYYFGGLPWLFVAFTSAWICQSNTLWFNVINHPIERKTDVHQQAIDGKKTNLKDTCVATNGQSWNGGPPGTKMSGYYLPFHFFNIAHYCFAHISGESDHDDHHVDARLAQRSPRDICYWSFVYPLEKLGLIWNVHHFPTSKAQKAL